MQITIPSYNNSSDGGGLAGAAKWRTDEYKKQTDSAHLCPPTLICLSNTQLFWVLKF